MASETEAVGVISDSGEVVPTPAQALPKLIVRFLEPADVDIGYLELIDQLSPIHPLTDLDEVKIMVNNHDLDYTVVIQDGNTGQLIATGRLTIQRKVAHSMGRLAHVEDIVVDKAYRGQKLGLLVFQELINLARRLKCYKLVLNCEESLKEYYKRADDGIKEEVSLNLYLDPKQT